MMLAPLNIYGTKSGRIRDLVQINQVVQILCVYEVGSSYLKLASLCTIGISNKVLK